MFIINIYLRLALIGLLLVGGILLAYFQGFWYSFPFFLAALILLVGYILLGTIQSAAQILQKTQDYEAAEKRLNLTLKPGWLLVTNRSYYYLLRATIAQGLKRIDEAEEWLEKARKSPFATDNEKAGLELQLANIAIQRQKWNVAKMHLKTLKELNVTEQVIKDYIRQLEMAIQQQGQAKAAYRMGMMLKGGAPISPGGKRRRPKMR